MYSSSKFQVVLPRYLSPIVVDERPGRRRIQRDDAPEEARRGHGGDDVAAVTCHWCRHVPRMQQYDGHTFWPQVHGERAARRIEGGLAHAVGVVRAESRVRGDGAELRRDEGDLRAGPEEPLLEAGFREAQRPDRVDLEGSSYEAIVQRLEGHRLRRARVH